MVDSNDKDPIQVAVAVDARGRCKGALEFCAWMQAKLQGQWKMTAAHALAPAELQEVQVSDQYRDIQFLARRAVQKVVESIEGDLEFGEVELLDEAAVEVSLEGFVDKTQAQILVLGRAAPSDEDRFIRLGPVARRLLRSLPCALMVVPPDLRGAAIGEGPVLLPVDGSDSTLNAFRQAQDLAARLGRELVLVHVADSPALWGYEFISPATIQSMSSDLNTTAIRNIERWLQEHALGGHRLVVRQGVVSQEVSLLAQELDACFIVTGSRELSTTERVFVTSVGSELSASANRPVLVVPGR